MFCLSYRLEILLHSTLTLVYPYPYFDQLLMKFGCRYFADRDIFCAGRVTSEDMDRVIQAVGGNIQSTCSDIQVKHLGTCEKFEERQVGGERFNFFEGCPHAKTCTLVLRGGAEQFIAEVERSLHDAIMIVKKAMKNDMIVAGGGAIEMEISKYLRDYSRTIAGKQQLIIAAFARSLEIIPRQLCDNAGFDATEILNQLRMKHAKGDTWAGVDMVNEGIRDNLEAFVWEPTAVKVNAIQAATEAACLVLSVDETISELSPSLSLSLSLSLCLCSLLMFFFSFTENEESAAPQAGPRMPAGAAQRALRTRGRMPRR